MQERSEPDREHEEIGKTPRRRLLSVVTPAYNEAQNLPQMYKRLHQTISSMELEWEWIIVDDHSADATFKVASQLAESDPRIRGFRLARNSGSHTATTCGLHNALGDCAVVLAGDLQDPPETLSALLVQWEAGAQVVWAVRGQREGEKVTSLGFSRLYYFLMRKVVGMRDIPATGADFFLLDRRVLDAFRQFRESNVSILALITWMGFRQASISYDKQARQHGRSGWTLEKKLKLVADSITSFSYLPIRVMSYLGFVVALLGFAYALVVIRNALVGIPVQGWASLIVVVLVLGGVQMLMMGVLGEYMWRALDETKRRPRYLIEDSFGEESDVVRGCHIQ